MASQCRSYDDALHLLSQLQSNKSAVNLFTTGKPQQNVNDVAVPEMQAWLQRAGLSLDHLMAGLRCVHVAGTKGKGSVATMVASILRQYPDLTGNGVGLYTSPHVTSVRERVVVDGTPVSRDVFARHFFELWHRLSAAARTAAEQGHVGAPTEDALEGGFDGPATKPFYFAFLTLLALRVFMSREGRAPGREHPRSVVVECGIGGAYDSTNALPTGCMTTSVVTQLGIDHVAMLGDTVEKIAWHKAGVFRPQRTAVTRRLDGAVMDVLRGRAAELGLRALVEVADDDVDAWAGVPDARMQGPFQKPNMALAAAAAREHILALGGRFEGPFGTPAWRLDDMPDAFVTGLREANIRARCETFDGDDGIQWFVDGAHTEDSLAGVASWFLDRAGGHHDVRVLVFNQQDRHPEPLLATLLEACSKDKDETYRVFHHAMFTRNELDAPLDHVTSRHYLEKQSRAADVMKSFDPRTDVRVQAAVAPCLHLVTLLNKEAERDGKKCKVLVTGSFHLVKTVLAVIDHTED